jgi:hypothetical protein
MITINLARCEGEVISPRGVKRYEMEVIFSQNNKAAPSPERLHQIYPTRITLFQLLH